MMPLWWVPEIDFFGNMVLNSLFILLGILGTF